MVVVSCGCLGGIVLGHVYLSLFVAVYQVWKTPRNVRLDFWNLRWSPSEFETHPKQRFQSKMFFNTQFWGVGKGNVFMLRMTESQMICRHKNTKMPTRLLIGGYLCWERRYWFRSCCKRAEHNFRDVLSVVCCLVARFNLGVSPCICLWHLIVVLIIPFDDGVGKNTSLINFSKWI